MVSRRNFIKASTLATASMVAGVGTGEARSIFDKMAKTSAPDIQKVKLACIGIGNRGQQNIKEFIKTGLVEVTALCDVDLDGDQCKWALQTFPKAQRFNDWRDLFEKFGNGFEAVCISTPDHSHFAIAMLALSEGKHVYLEKPMCRTFFEAELMMAAARKHPDLATQVGNQGHSDANYFQFKTWKEEGIIKDVTRIDVHMNSSRRWHGFDSNIKKFPDAEPLPKNMNWEAWLGPTPWHDYNAMFHQGNWRCWYDLGMGALGDWGAHLIDTAHEFLELGLPYEIEMQKAEGHNDFFFPYSSTIFYRFGPRGDMPPVDITWYDGVTNFPPLPEGFGKSEFVADIPSTNQGAYKDEKLNPGKIIYSRELTFKGGSHGSTLSIIPESKAKEMESRLPEVPASPSNHYLNFLRAVRGEEKTRSPFEINGVLNQVFSLGVIAQRLNTKLYFDPRTKRITNNDFADAMLTGVPPRSGWEYLYKL